MTINPRNPVTFGPWWRSLRRVRCPWISVIKVQLVLTMIFTAACRKHETADPPKRSDTFTSTPVPPVKREWGEARFDVCALLMQTEVGEIGERSITQTKSAGGTDDSLFISQCFYLAENSDVVAVISVIEKDPHSSSGQWPNDLWAEMFEGAGNKKLDEDDEERSEGKKRVPPQGVEGVGDAAYWTNGALYVRTGDKMLRIAITSSDTLASKLNKATALGRKVIPRL